MSKVIIVVLLALLLVLQYELWFSAGGLLTVHQLQKGIKHQRAVNHQLALRNRSLLADIRDLKQGTESIEARARSELGMVKQHEIFYREVKKQNDKSLTK